MKNREYILNKSTYDLLLQMQKNRGFCVLDDISELPSYCIALSAAEVESCEECIQRWLNEENKCTVNILTKRRPSKN